MSINQKCKYCKKPLPLLIFRDIFGREKDTCLIQCKKCGKCKTKDDPYCSTCSGCGKCLENGEGIRATGLRSILGIRWCVECCRKAFEENEKIRIEKEEKEYAIQIEKEYIIQQHKLEQQLIQNTRYEKYLEFRKQIEQMPIYNRWRNDVINRCGNKCQKCGINNNLEVHHRVSLYSLIKRFQLSTIEQAFECNYLWSIENGEVLCKECHDQMESSKKRESLVSKVQ